MPSGAVPITILLRRIAGGDRAAEEALLNALYHELRQLAQRHMRRERADHTLQPSALVNEAYVRMLGGAAPEWRDRVHFFASASTVMRRVLVDYARRHAAAKRGGEARAEELQEWMLSVNHTPERILGVHEALTRYADVDPRKARVVELRFFAGLTDEEVAHVLGVSLRTVKRDWREAKAWLYDQLSG